MPVTISIIFYAAAMGVLLRSFRSGTPPVMMALRALIGLGIAAHGMALAQQMIVPSGYHFSFFKITSLFFCAANFLLLCSALGKPLHNLFIVVLPLSIATLLASLFVEETTGIVPLRVTQDVFWHIILSILAYSTMIIATMQAILLAFQDHKIRHKHPSGWIRHLPPLLTMEALLFELLWVGQGLLTLVIVTGAFHVEDLREQHLHHKIVFTMVAWVIYAILLGGRHFLGWRGTSAIRWTLSGFGSLLLAYLGSKLVLNMILA